MNPSLEMILSRRSVRAYLPDAVPEADESALLEAASSAPSAMNYQPWLFTVIASDEVRAKINKAHRRFAFARADVRMMDVEDIFFDAPLAILVSADTAYPNTFGDCGGACENICLAASALGYGSCIVGYATEVLTSEEGADALRALSLPKGFVPYAAVIVGKRNERVGLEYKELKKNSVTRV